jgi:bacteriocin-like protein
MKTINDLELAEIVGGADSFWQDVGQFVGGFVGSLRSGYGWSGIPTPFYGAFLAGTVAAVYA